MESEELRKLTMNKDQVFDLFFKQFVHEDMDLLGELFACNILPDPDMENGWRCETLFKGIGNALKAMLDTMGELYFVQDIIREMKTANTKDAAKE